MFRVFCQNFRSKTSQTNLRRYASSKTNNFKIALCGAGGRLGQAAALLLKVCPLMDEIALYDVVRTQGIAMELSHVDTNCKVVAYSGKIKEALENAHIVAIVAGAPKIMSTDVEDNLQMNAIIVSSLMNSCAQYCPQAIIAIATNPLNSIIPAAAEVLKKAGAYNPKHLFGITTLDVMRASSIAAKFQGLAPENVYVPVIGGSSKTTSVPLFSHTRPMVEFQDEELVCMTNYTHDNITTTNHTSAYLAGATGVSRFLCSLARALKGEEHVMECAFVPTDDFPNLGFFACPIELGIDGLQNNFGIPKLTEYEYCQFIKCMEILKEDIEAGITYISPKQGKRKIVCEQI